MRPHGSINPAANFIMAEETQTRDTTKAGALAALASGAGLAAYAVRGRSSSVFAPSVYRGVASRRAVAFTFDDGPSESTPELLDLLARHNAPATFFQCGMHARRLGPIARDVAGAGHEIGNHTDTHPLLLGRSSAFVAAQIGRAQESIEDATGIRPRFFRAPYGVRWFGLLDAQAQHGLMGVMWTTIGIDWDLPAPRIAARLLRGARNGAIFCLHDGRGARQGPDIRETLGAVRRVLPILADKGYHFERVSEILCPTM